MLCMKLTAVLAVLIVVSAIVDKHVASASIRKSYQASFPTSSAAKGIFPYIRLPGAISETLTRFTLCFWARPTSSDTETIFSYAIPGSYGAHNEIWIGISPKYGVSFAHHTNNHDIVASTTITLDQWIHACVKWSSVTGKAEIYVNGSLAQSATGIGKGVPVATGGVLVLGQDQDEVEGGFQAAEAWNGDISEVQMWDDHLTADDILEIARCNFDQEGNVISWKEMKMVIYAGVQLRPITLPCGDHFYT